MKKFSEFLREKTDFSHVYVSRRDLQRLQHDDRLEPCDLGMFGIVASLEETGEMSELIKIDSKRLLDSKSGKLKDILSINDIKNILNKLEKMNEDTIEFFISTELEARNIDEAIVKFVSMNVVEAIQKFVRTFGSVGLDIIHRLRALDDSKFCGIIIQSKNKVVLWSSKCLIAEK